MCIRDRQFALALFDIQSKVESHNENQVTKLLVDLRQNQHVTHAQHTQLSSLAVQLGYMLKLDDFAKLSEELVSYNDTNLALSCMRSRIESITPSLS